MTRTQRLIRIIQLLQAGRRCKSDWLAAELSVSRRTLLRDIKVLREAGVGCEYDAESETYRLDHSYYLRPLNLTIEEALAIMHLTRKFAGEPMVPSSAAVMSAGLKIEGALPAHIRAHCGRLLEGVEMGRLQVSDVGSVTDALFKIQEAIALRRKIRMKYDSYYDKKEIATVLHPYCLTFRSRGWYVIGKSESHRKIRTFKIERIVDMEVLDAAYRPDKNFNADDYFGNSWNMIRGDRSYHVEVHFARLVAGNVEEVAWHPTQRTKKRSDGTLIFEADVDGIEEISWWVLGYGDQAVVAEPEALRRLVASHAANLVRYYENGHVVPKSRA